LDRAFLGYGFLVVSLLGGWKLLLLKIKRALFFISGFAIIDK